MIKDLKKQNRIKDIKVVEFEYEIFENLGEYNQQSGLTPRHKDFDDSHPDIEQKIETYHNDNQLDNGVRIQVESFYFYHSDDSITEKKQPGLKKNTK